MTPQALGRLARSHAEIDCERTNEATELRTARHAGGLAWRQPRPTLSRPSVSCWRACSRRDLAALPRVGWKRFWLIVRTWYGELDTEAELARRELAEREALLALREIRSPVDGVIVDRFHNVGDIVHSERVFRLLRLDPLHVELVIPVVGFGNFRDGDQRQIRIPHLREVHTVRVINVDRVVDPGSNTFRVRLALPNPGLRIPSGLRCEMLE
jgi:hypothetical protein